MHVKKLCKEVVLDPQSDGKGRVVAKGVMRQLSVFPPSKPGGSGPFSNLTKPTPGSLDFKPWVTYYINFIGSTLEKLNAMQFDLCEKVNKHEFQTLLKRFAEELNPANPDVVSWPVRGPYLFQPTDPGWPKFDLRVYFELDHEVELVVNAAIQVEAESVSPTGDSSSSYLATSSS